ncbi:AAEL012724-PA [Aedes aegypti]|uniref:AAEL012724-PA n=1 Tax=Aedes aegypti TaxID=7159 RepID=Q16L97_AEDAE|nr:AAEL012724-PA [Aedes aegypti]
MQRHLICPGDLVTFPTNYQEYHFKSAHSMTEFESLVTYFDDALYQAMHQPLRIEMERVFMEELTLPPALLLGNFASNIIHSVNVSSDQNYRIAYLDLESNRLRNIEFVSKLVKLEILHLERNMIGSIPGSVLSSLTELKHLYLQRNFIATIPWNELPRGLIHLDCFANFVDVVEFTNVSLPSLEYLNLRYNKLSAINVTALLLVAPKLKDVYLFNDRVNESRMDEIKAELAENNISFVEKYEYWHLCFQNSNLKYVDGRCLRYEELPITTGKAVLLSCVTIGVAVLFAYILLLFYRHMNR